MTKYKYINLSQVEEYENIFGFEKLKKIFIDYQEQSNQFWSTLDELDSKTQEELRILFHNWRSSSLIFGMDGFALLCEQAENLIVNGKNTDKLPEIVSQAKIVFEAHLIELKYFFNRTEL